MSLLVSSLLSPGACEMLIHKHMVPNEVNIYFSFSHRKLFLKTMIDNFQVKTGQTNRKNTRVSLSSCEDDLRHPV